MLGVGGRFCLGYKAVDWGLTVLKGSDGKMLKDREENERGLNVVRDLDRRCGRGVVYEK